jgi:hypothetical protein
MQKSKQENVIAAGTAKSARSGSARSLLPRLFMNRVAAQLLAVFLEFQPLSSPRFLRGAVVTLT